MSPICLGAGRHGCWPAPPFRSSFSWQVAAGRLRGGGGGERHANGLAGHGNHRHQLHRLQRHQQSSGQALEQFTATLSGGGAASVTWTVSGGDANAGAGTISSSGQYTPPPYLTANSVQVTVKATLTSGTGTSSATVTVTPGFLQPLSPENVALGVNGTATITGYIAEAGGSTGINYAVFQQLHRMQRRTGLRGHLELRAQQQRVHLLHRHLHGAGDSFVHRPTYVWAPSALRLQNRDSGSVEHRGNFQQSRHAPNATGDAYLAGQFRRQ